MKLFGLLSLTFFFYSCLFAQIGGDNTYEFLNLISSSRISALGNVLVNAVDDDINLAQQLPSLNNQEMNHQFSINYTNYYAGVNFGSLLYGVSSSKFENITIGLKYLNYGDFTRTDEFGFVLGNFTAGEYAFYLSSLIFKSKSLRLGSSLKFVYSNLDAYNSFGFLTDLSATYELKKNRILASLLVKNAGFQLKTYDQIQEPMPFEAIFGLSSKLEYAPLRWSISWSHIEKWDLTYAQNQNNSSDPLTNEEIDEGSSFREKILSHLHLGGEFLFTKNFHVRAGYNFRRRQEMALDLFKHNVGLSWGFGMRVSKFHFNYARAAYHAAGPMHTFSITTNLKKF
jgi:hypothetical protein